jgi:putative thioredoxin
MPGVPATEGLTYASALRYRERQRGRRKGEQVDTTDATFDLDVIDRSREVAVIVDFWAPWCAPCRQLTPLLEAAVARHEDEILLAKVNIDENPMLAQRYRVMSIPLVKVFRNGDVVDEFTGLQSAHTIDAFINRQVPSKADRLVELGDEASLREALELDPANTGARLALARMLIGDGDTTEIAELLTPVSYDPEAAGLLARVELMGSDQPDIQAGLAAWSAGLNEQALSHLLDAVRGADDAGQRDLLRATLVGMYAELGEHHPLTARFRKRLAQALY